MHSRACYWLKVGSQIVHTIIADADLIEIHAEISELLGKQVHESV